MNETVVNIEGRQPIIEAFRSGQTINKLWIAKGEQHGSVREIISEAHKSGVIIQEVERKFLDSLSETGAHQGIIAQISPVDYVEFVDLLAKAKANSDADWPSLFLVLDEIQDPHNLGSLLRTAETMGATGVIIPKRRAVGITATVMKASAGAAAHVPVSRVTNISDAIAELKEAGCWVAGADMKGSPCHQARLDGPLALVIGGEGRGLGKRVSDNCDFLVSIPMFGKVGSLNAAVAGGMLMYEISRQRTSKKI